MKLSGLIRKTRWGIAMTEYLIILGIVAIAAIAIVGLFGKQIKETFSRTTSALAGTDKGDGAAKANTGKANTEAGKTDTLSDFDKSKNTPQ